MKIRAGGGPNTGADSPSFQEQAHATAAEHLRLLLSRNGQSLEEIAADAGLAKNKIDAVASGKAAPSLNLLWKIATTLGVPFGSLLATNRRQDLVLRQAATTILSSSDGGLTSRALLPHDASRPVEFYELTIAPHHFAQSEAHGAETLESLVVVRGAVEITAGKEPPQKLQEGDAMVFQSDVPHTYRNLGPTEALLYLVMSYADLASR